MPAKFTVYKDKAGQFRFNLKATNGELVVTSECYPNSKSALKGIASLVKSSATAKIEDSTVEKVAPKKPEAKAAAKTRAAAKPKASAKPKAAAKSGATAKAAPKAKAAAEKKAKGK